MSHHFSPSVDHAANGNLAKANVPYWGKPVSAKAGLETPYHPSNTGSGVDQFHLFGRNRNCQTTPSMSLMPNHNTPTAWCNSLNNMNIPNMSQTSDSTWNSYHSSPTQQLAETSGYSQKNSNFNASWQNAKLLSPLQISPNASIAQNFGGRKSASSFTNGSNFNENSTTSAKFSPVRRSCSNTMESRMCGQQKSFPISPDNGTKNSDSGTKQIQSETEDSQKYHTSLPSSSTSSVIDRHDIEAARTNLFIQSVEQQNTTTVSTDDQDEMGITSSENMENSESGVGKSPIEEIESRDIKMEDDSFDRQLVMDDESSRSTISTHDVSDQLQNPSNPEDQLPESFIDDKIQEFMNRRQPAVYTCKVCQYTCAQKFHFNSHMNTHTDRKCTMCDYTSRTEGRLKKHMNEAHIPLPTDSGGRSTAEDDASEVFDPMSKSHQYSPPSPDGYLCDSEMADDSRGDSFSFANSNDMLHSSSITHHPSSKPKHYKCKQCHYIAPSKDNFWEHQRSHIKPERLMSCPHCLFVTEYKHHMEYHLRNHSNVKPHKCPKCNYCCVNKSMLNSHLKSHSSVYQYRCRDCSYETKYCHSLKQHLRKHNHRPGKLVNQDGVEQEIQLDVYGNRRGPKVRRNNNSNNNNVNSEKTSSGSDKDGIFDQQPAVVVTRVNSKPTSTRNSPNLAQQLISPLSLLDTSNAASILAAQNSSNIYQNLLVNRGGICSNASPNNNLTNGLASVPFLGAGGSMGVQLPTVPDLLTAAAAATTSSSSSSCAQTDNNGDVEKFKQMLAAQYFFVLKQQAMAAAAAAAAAAINSSRSTPNVAAATAGENAFLLNGGDAGLIFSSTGYAQGGIGNFGCNKEQLDHEQRVRSRSFIVSGSLLGTLTTSKSNYIKPNIDTEKSIVPNNGLAPSTPTNSLLRLPRENLKFPSISADISSVTASVAYPLSVGTASPRCRSRSPVCEVLKASCSSDDGSGSNASNGHTNGGTNFCFGNGSSRRKGKAFKLVDSIAMRLQSGNSRSPPVEHVENENVNEVENILKKDTPSIAEYFEENMAGSINLQTQSADICSTDHQNDQQPNCDNHNNNDAHADQTSTQNHSHSSIIQQSNNQSSLVTTTSNDARMIVDGQQRDQSTVIDFSRSYHCSHCGIWFKCQIMYLLHKGCHSSDNPFKCNLCGATCDDPLKFFLHITQAPHDEL